MIQSTLNTLKRLFENLSRCDRRKLAEWRRDSNVSLQRVVISFCIPQ